MNLATMLMQTVTPLSEREVTPKPGKGKGQTKCMKHANVAKSDKAKARYQVAWRDDEWLGTQQIEARLGYMPGASLDTLKAWVAEGVLECRERVPGKRKQGLEWRWK